MRDDAGWDAWVSATRRRTEGVLERALPPGTGDTARLADAMRYATLGGGKRVRALLAYAAGELTGAEPSNVDAVAAAVELIHAYSLVHDDLPCMDDDVLRRGKPTCHVKFDQATALLAGDALQSLAFAVVAAAPLADPGRACAVLAAAAGAGGMAGGQAIDLVSVGRVLDVEALERMHRLKTGALIAAAVRLGAMCGRALDAREAEALAAYAAASGLAFQVVDDVLDVEGSAVTLGKTAGKDAEQDKPTYVSVLGLDEAKRRAERLRADAHAALAVFGARAERLAALADWITLRRH